MLIENIRTFFEDELLYNDEYTIKDWLLIIGICVLFAFLASFDGCVAL